MTIRLYSWPQSSGTRVAWALEELGLPYEYVQVNSWPQSSGTRASWALEAPGLPCGHAQFNRERWEHCTPAFRAMNPHGRVPTLVDAEWPLFESDAILLYLGSTYGVSKHLWPPPDGPAYASAVSWTVWAGTELETYMMQYLSHGMDTPVSYAPADRSKAAARDSRSRLERMLDELEVRLKAREYLLCSFSLVDVASAGRLLMGASLGLRIDQYSRVSAWCKRCAERPAFKRAR